MPSLNVSRQPEDVRTIVSVYAHLSVCTWVKVLQTCDRTSGEHTCHGTYGSDFQTDSLQWLFVFANYL